MSWRKAWAKNWDAVKFCSEACRRQRLGEQDLALEGAILELLAGRARGASICPSEAARSLFPDEARWRPLMEPARQAARRLVARGAVEITQGGRPVDPSTAKGPIRVRLR
jgi:hypothetical protein